MHRAQRYKSFYVCNLQMLIIKYSVWLSKALPSYSNVCGYGQESNPEWSTWKVLTRVGSALLTNLKLARRNFLGTTTRASYECSFKLDRLSLASLFSLIKSFWVRPEATRVKYISRASLSDRFMPLSTTNIRLGWKGLQGINALAYYDHCRLQPLKAL